MGSKAKSGGVGCLTVVGIVLVMLKLLEIKPVAGWSWWWVTAPFWGPFAAWAVVMAALACLVWWARR